MQRLGLSRIVFSRNKNASAEFRGREKVIVDLVPRAIGPLTAQMLLEEGPSERFFIVPANIYCDARLLAALCAEDSPAALVDSNPPEFARSLIRSPCGPALVTRDFLSAFLPTAPFFEELKDKIDNGETDIIDAAAEDDYIVSMRRRVRPVCFPAPPEQNRRLAERIILDSAQNGTLDLPAYFHAPIRNGNHPSLQNANHLSHYVAGFIIGCSATAAFALGRVGLGILAALMLALSMDWTGNSPASKSRPPAWQVGTSSRLCDREFAWWATIAFHLWRSAQFPNVFYFFALLVGSHLLDELAKRRAKMAKGRLLDDVTPFDRAFRLIAARRNVYVWILACGFLLHAFPQSYAIICGWAAVSAAVHLVRSICICNASRRRVINSRA